MNADSLARKVIACLVAGFTISALILQVGRDYRPAWMNPSMVFLGAGVSVVAALIYSFYWHLKKRNNSAIFSVVLTVMCYALAFGIALFGWKKIFKLQFQVPLSMLSQPFNELSGEWLTWAYFGYSYPFGLLVAFAQLGGAMLLLFPKTRLLGVFILLPVLINILFINVFYHLNAGALLQSIILTLGVLYLLSLHLREVIAFFFRSTRNEPRINNALRLGLFSAILLPLWLVFSVDKTENDELDGSYKVINSWPALSRSANLASGLSKVYFDKGNVIVLEYGTHKNRKVAAYSYNRNTHLLKAVFAQNKLSQTLLVEIKVSKNQMIMSGENNKDPFSVELKKH